MRVLIQAVSDGKQVLSSLFFILRRIRINFYSSGLRKHHMEWSDGFHSSLEYFSRVGTRGVACLAGTSFPNNLLEIRDMGISQCGRVHGPLYKIQHQRGLRTPRACVAAVWIHKK